MTLTIDLSPAEETWLETAVQQTGLTPNTLVKNLLRERLPALIKPVSTSEEARVAAIWAAVGSMAHIGVSVEDLHRERQSDKQKEEAQNAGEA